jgi:hypothetical protein
MRTPVNGVPVGSVLGSVHRHRRLTCPSVPAVMAAWLQRLTCPRQRAFAPGHQARYPSGYTQPPAEEPVTMPRFPAAFRPPAFASWASFPARGFRPPYGRPTALPAPASTDPDRVSTFRTRETRLGRASSIPRGQRCRHGRERYPSAACRLTTASPCHPGPAHRPGMLL